MKKIFVIGASGHGKVIIDILEKQNKYHIAGLLDDKYKGSVTEFCGYPIIEKISAITELKRKNDIGGIIAIGDNWTRYRVFQKIKSLLPDFSFITAIHPSACIGRDVTIGDGTVVMAGTSINSGTKIGNFCIINTNSSIDHDNVTGDFSSIAPGVTTGGNVTIGSYSSISLGANIIHGIAIGEQTVIGAGSTVLSDIPSYSVAYGLPAKVIRKRAEGDKYL